MASGEPDRVVNPELPEEERELLAKEPDDTFTPGHSKPPRRADPVPEAFSALVAGAGAFGVVGLITFFLWAWNGEHGKAVGAAGLLDVAVTVGMWLLPLIVVGAVGFAVHDGVTARRKNTEARRAFELREHCVTPQQLTEDAGALLRRAQEAGRTVRKSRVHVQGLIDRQRNELLFPQQEWEIAETLREYSLLVRKTPEEARGEAVTRLLDSRSRALRESRKGVERRVKALERYARQAEEADARLIEWEQIQALSSGSGDVLDLLARAARDDLAVAEIEGLTGEAAAVANAFKDSLESAKEAAVAALPQHGTAA